MVILQCNNIYNITQFLLHFWSNKFNLGENKKSESFKNI